MEECDQLSQKLLAMHELLEPRVTMVEAAAPIRSELRSASSDLRLCDFALAENGKIRSTLFPLGDLA